MLFLIAIVVAGFTVYLVKAHQDLAHLCDWIVVFLVSWIPVEIAAAVYLRTNNNLSLVGPKAANDA
ncbi:MAG TPA: hypothetical protein VGM98_10685 [Schlesneria sp.]